MGLPPASLGAELSAGGHGGDVEVARVNVGSRAPPEALEYAFERTNNREGSWSLPATLRGDDGEVEANPDFSEDVEVLAQLPTAEDGRVLGLRSTSVGDRMVFRGETYEVAGTGFRAVGRA